MRHLKILELTYELVKEENDEELQAELGGRATSADRAIE